VLPEPDAYIFSIGQQFSNGMKKAGKGYTEQVQCEGYLNGYLFVDVVKR
jgi:hypothetical protein